MARGNLPAQTPQVPRDVFIPFDLLYRHVTDLSQDVRALEGTGPPIGPGLVSDTTLDLDTAMSVKVAANAKGRIFAELYVTANVKLRLVGPASPAMILVEQTLQDGAFTSSLLTAYSGADIVTAVPTRLCFCGLIYNGTTAGVLGISWAQQVSSLTPAGFYRGSTFRYSPLV